MGRAIHQNSFAIPSRPTPLPFKRLLSREQAAYYLDVSMTKFDQMVADGRMPKPKKMDSRKAWDIHAIDVAIDALPSEGVTPKDDNINDWD